MPILSTHRLLGAFGRALSGSERIAGLVVEQERVRFAEFRISAGHDEKGEHRELVEEGAAFLPKGTIQDGRLAHADDLTKALRGLIRHGIPQRLSAGEVVLSLPLSRIVGRTVEIPQTVRAEELDQALRLEIERTLPFPFEETYLDWQPLREDVVAGGGRRYVFVAARKQDVDAYVGAVEAAGLGVVAVEPITMSIARGLEARNRNISIAVVYADALLAAGTDGAGNVRFFHHRSLPPLADTSPRVQESEERAGILSSELASFIRFFKTESGGAEGKLVIDGVFDEASLRAVRRVAAGLSVEVVLEHETHGLSRAAARGAALRAVMPRRDDRLISLMAVGTEAVYAQHRSVFFVRAALRAITLGVLAAAILFAAASVALGFVSRALRLSTQSQLTTPPGTEQTFGQAEAINMAISRANALLQFSEIPPALPGLLASTASEGIRVDRISVRTAEAGIQVELAVEAETSQKLLEQRSILQERFTNDTFLIPSELLLAQPTNLPFLYTFFLKPDFAE